jgi:hypothetical protein
MNIITGALGFPNKTFFRAIDGHVFRFYSESYDLDLLRDEIDSIMRILQKRSSQQSHETRLGRSARLHQLTDTRASTMLEEK